VLSTHGLVPKTHLFAHFTPHIDIPTMSVLTTSSESLAMSIQSRSSSTYSLSTDIGSLYRLLAVPLPDHGAVPPLRPSTEAVTAALEEYAWRALIRGTRVRDWSEGLRTRLEDVSSPADPCLPKTNNMTRQQAASTYLQS
jgi:hypothetical protein